MSWARGAARRGLFLAAVMLAAWLMERYPRSALAAYVAAWVLVPPAETPARDPANEAAEPAS